MTSSDEEAKRSRKRQRRTARDEDDDGKKQRGRPRVDGVDETAADRRRTQIRLAQRAYRQRKETTIASLKQQVSDLQVIIDEMNKSVLGFWDVAATSGLSRINPQLAHELKKITEQIVALSKSAHPLGTSDDDGETSPLDDSGSNGRKRKQPRRTPLDEPAVRAPRATAKQQSASSTTTTSARKAIDIGWGYQQVLEVPVVYSNNSDESVHLGILEDTPQSDIPSTAGNPADSTIPTTGTNVHSYISNHRHSVSETFAYNAAATTTAGPDDFQNYRAVLSSASHNDASLTPPASVSSSSPPSGIFRIPSPAKTMSLKLPYTYSFQETTFARRLHRATLERGFHLLSTAHLRPHHFNRVFRICLTYSDRDKLLERFRTLLTKGTRHSLEFAGGPYVHLGGAGMHFPRRTQGDQEKHSGSVVNTDGAEGVIERKETGWRVRFVDSPTGKSGRLLLDREEGDRVSFTREIDLEGWDMDDDWYDPSDVAGYLESKGVNLDGQISYADVEVDTANFPGLAPELNGPTSSEVMEVTFATNEQLQSWGIGVGLDVGFGMLSANSLQSTTNSSSGPSDSGSRPSASTTRSNSDSVVESATVVSGEMSYPPSISTPASFPHSRAMSLDFTTPANTVIPSGVGMLANNNSSAADVSSFYELGAMDANQLSATSTSPMMPQPLMQTHTAPISGDLFPFDNSGSEEVPDFWSMVAGGLGVDFSSEMNASSSTNYSSAPLNNDTLLPTSAGTNDLGLDLNWVTSKNNNSSTTANSSAPSNTLPQSAYTASHQYVPQQEQDKRRMQKITIDIGKMIEGITSQAVCLGRAPGFRKRDVDAAIASAITLA